MTRGESKLLIDAVARVERSLEEVKKEQKALRNDVSKLQSFKLQVVAWGAGAATTLGVLFPKAAEWLTNTPKN